MTPAVVVAGIGSEWRGDDGVGPAVVGRVAARLAPDRRAGLRLLGPLGDPLDLLGLWDDAALAVVVDATRSGLAAGTVHQVALDGSDPPAAATTSSHGIGLAGVLRIARAVGRAPQRTVVIGVEGASFARGAGLTPAVAAAVEPAATAVLALVEAVAPCA